MVTCRDRLSGGPARRSVTRMVEIDGSGVDLPAVDVVIGPDLMARSASEIWPVVEQALEGRPAVLCLQLAEVERFDAAGIGLLLHVHERARRAHTQLVCAGLPRQLLVVLRRRHLDRVLTVTTQPSAQGPRT